MGLGQFFMGVRGSVTPCLKSRAGARRRRTAHKLATLFLTARTKVPVRGSDRCIMSRKRSLKVSKLCFGEAARILCVIRAGFELGRGESLSRKRVLGFGDKVRGLLDTSVKKTGREFLQTCDSVRSTLSSVGAGVGVYITSASGRSLPPGMRSVVGGFYGARGRISPVFSFGCCGFGSLFRGTGTFGPSSTASVGVPLRSCNGIAGPRGTFCNTISKTRITS